MENGFDQDAAVFAQWAEKNRMTPREFYRELVGREVLPDTPYLRTLRDTLTLADAS